MSLINKPIYSLRRLKNTDWTENTLVQKVGLILAKTKRAIKRPSFPVTEDGKLNLHLGCGKINHSQFVNIDALPASHIHYIRNLSDSMPFLTETVDLIYSCHCLEHFSHTEISQVLSEWFRVLKVGGILRISVPNFDYLVQVYQKNNYDVGMIMLPLMGAQNHQYNYHKIIFNKQSLTQLLEKTGFKKVQAWQPGSSELTTFSDWSSKPVSLNLEGIK